MFVGAYKYKGGFYFLHPWLTFDTRGLFNGYCIHFFLKVCLGRSISFSRMPASQIVAVSGSLRRWLTFKQPDAVVSTEVRHYLRVMYILSLSRFSRTQI